MAERPRGPALLAAGALAASEAARDLSPARWLAAMAHPDLTDIAEVVFAYAALPRAAAALACGAALGLGAALFGLALCNPLAVPDSRHQMRSQDIDAPSSHAEDPPPSVPSA